jgi:hypothetical protein
MKHKESKGEGSEKPAMVFRWCDSKACPKDSTCTHGGYFFAKYAEDGSAEYTPAKWTREPTKVEKNLYTADSVRESIKPDYDTYYAKLALGQNATWKCDQRTKDIFCLHQWIMNELMKLECPDEDRRFIQNYFNRKSRAEDDLYEVAARAMNTFLNGTIERVRRRPIIAGG